MDQFLKMLRRARCFITLGLDGMPGELRRGSLFLSEQNIETDHPIALTARPDQVFTNDAGFLVPVELKHRRQWIISPADRLQLSVVATILRNRPEKTPAVAGHGYVRFKSGQRSKWMRVSLFPDQIVIASWLASFAPPDERISMLRDLIETARPALNPGPRIF